MANLITGPISGPLGLLTARHAAGSLIMGGIDILVGVTSESILSFAYTDNSTDMADDVTIMIADPHRTWMLNFMPKKGSECLAKINVYNWNILGDMRSLDCGVFWIDELSFAGPPNVVTVKAMSIPILTGVKNEKRDEHWEQQDLKSIANKIAENAGLTLVWATKKENPQLDALEQTNATDLDFLQDKLKDNGLSMKLYKRQLVVMSEQEYEAQAPAYVITYGHNHILSYSFTSKLEEIFAEAENTYMSPVTGKMEDHKFNPNAYVFGEGPQTVFEDLTTPPVTQKLRTNEKEDNPADEDNIDIEPGEPPGFRLGVDTHEIADYTTGSPASNLESPKPKSKLRDKNKREKEGNIVVVGNVEYLSGLCLQLVGFGIYDIKWFIVSTLHSVSSAGYTTELKIRGALSY